MTISIIVPFFDEYIFLPATVKCLLALGGDLKEIIIVNDNPCDTSAAFLSKFDQIPTVKIVHNAQNSGAPASRNNGLAQARGDYVLFLDSDDWVSPKALKDALAYACKTQCDILHLPTLIATRDNGTYRKFPRDVAFFAKKQSGLQVEKAPHLPYATASWSFLYRRAFLLAEEIHFDPVLTRREDHVFILQLTAAAQSIATFDQWVHVWLMRGGSVSSAQRNWTDYRMQVLSIQKALEILMQSNSVNDVAVQRDVCFALLRLANTWQLLADCIACQKTEETAGDILKQLQHVFSPHTLSADMRHDPLVEKFLNFAASEPSPSITNFAGLEYLLQAIKAGDWAKVARSLELDSPAPTASDDQRAGQLPIFWEPTEANEDAANAIQGARSFQMALKTQHRDENNDKQSIGRLAQYNLLCAGNVNALLLGLYVARVEDKAAREHRLASEFFLDIVDQFAGLPAQEMNVVQTNGAVIEFSVSWPLPSQALATLEQETLTLPAFARALSIVGARRCGATTKANTHTILQRGLDSSLWQAYEQAFLATSHYLHTVWQNSSAINYQAVGEVPDGSKLRRGDVAHAWRGVETILLSDIWEDIVDNQIKNANAMRYGDANWFGERTVKSRLKYLLGRGALN